MYEFDICLLAAYCSPALISDIMIWNTVGPLSAQSVLYFKYLTAVANLYAVNVYLNSSDESTGVQMNNLTNIHRSSILWILQNFNEKSLSSNDISPDNYPDAALQANVLTDTPAGDSQMMQWRYKKVGLAMVPIPHYDGQELLNVLKARTAVSELYDKALEKIGRQIASLKPSDTFSNGLQLVKHLDTAIPLGTVSLKDTSLWKSTVKVRLEEYLASISETYRKRMTNFFTNEITSNYSAESFLDVSRCQWSGPYSPGQSVIEKFWEMSEEVQSTLLKEYRLPLTLIGFGEDKATREVSILRNEIYSEAATLESTALVPWMNEQMSRLVAACTAIVKREVQPHLIIPSPGREYAPICEFYWTSSVRRHFERESSEQLKALNFLNRVYFGKHLPSSPFQGDMNHVVQYWRNNCEHPIPSLLTILGLVTTVVLILYRSRRYLAYYSRYLWDEYIVLPLFWLVVLGLIVLLLAVTIRFHLLSSV